MKRRLVRLSLLFPVVSVVTWLTLRPASGAGSPGAVPAVVTAAAARMSKSLGDDHPKSATYVETTRRSGEAAIGNHLFGPDTPVYLVLLRGTFVKRNYYGPVGQRGPLTGSVVTFTIDKRTQKILDFSIGDRSYDLSPLSHVVSFRPTP